MNRHSDFCLASCFKYYKLFTLNAGGLKYGTEEFSVQQNK